MAHSFLSTLKWTLVASLALTMAACSQSQVAFYGYPSAHQYASNAPILDEQLMLTSASQAADEAPLPNVYAAARVAAPTTAPTAQHMASAFNALTPAAGNSKTHATAPAVEMAALPSCPADASLAYDAKGIPTCFTPTADGGQNCTDSSQCSSYCVVGDNASASTGACFSLLPFTGCENVLLDGKVQEVCS